MDQARTTFVFVHCVGDTKRICTHKEFGRLMRGKLRDDVVGDKVDAILDGLA